MKKSILVFAILFSGNLILAQTKTYKGAWFEIKYPSSFTAKGSLKSATSQDGYESAIFESPDHLVEFYVFSPQWSGDATDISIKQTEKLVTTKTQKSGDQVTKWWTISAKDGSYTRSYQEKRDDELHVNWILGIRYKNSVALDKYKKQYLAFKTSLQQFAD